MMVHWLGVFNCVFHQIVTVVVMDVYTGFNNHNITVNLQKNLLTTKLAV